VSDTPQLLLAHHLKALKLPTFLREHDKLARRCAAEGADHTAYLLRLSELELLDRERRMIERRIREARFPAVKGLDSFDFAAIPALNKMLVLELARCEYVERRENVIALGPSGTGKTHVALGLGLAACQKGLAVGFVTAAALVRELLEARDERRLLRLQKQLAAYKLLIIDELGYVPLSPSGAGRGGAGRSFCSRSSAVVMSGARSWSPATSPSTSGPRCSARSASPARSSTGSPTGSRTTSTSSR
jgi:DNA replication protein DnaC